MTKEAVEKYIEFFENTLLKRVSGQTYALDNGRNKTIKESAKDALYSTSNSLMMYADMHEDLLNFMAECKCCEPQQLTSYEIKNIEHDTKYFIIQLQSRLKTLNDEIEEIESAD